MDGFFYHVFHSRHFLQTLVPRSLAHSPWSILRTSQSHRIQHIWTSGLLSTKRNTDRIELLMDHLLASGLHVSLLFKPLRRVSKSPPSAWLLCKELHDRALSSCIHSNRSWLPSWSPGQSSRTEAHIGSLIAGRLNTVHNFNRLYWQRRS